MYPQDFLQTDELDNESDNMCRGGSADIDPLGRYVAESLYNIATVTIADLDMGIRAKGKYDFDVNDHYARRDMFDLFVDETKRCGVALYKTITSNQLLLHNLSPLSGRFFVVGKQH